MATAIYHRVSFSMDQSKVTCSKSFIEQLDEQASATNNFLRQANVISHRLYDVINTAILTLSRTCFIDSIKYRLSILHTYSMKIISHDPAPF
jgi:hypothetical protein